VGADPGIGVCYDLGAGGTLEDEGSCCFGLRRGGLLGGTGCHRVVNLDAKGSADQNQF
jgi:hypothetical protein